MLATVRGQGQKGEAVGRWWGRSKRPEIKRKKDRLSFLNHVKKGVGEGKRETAKD